MGQNSSADWGSCNRSAARQPILVTCSQRIAYKLCLITYKGLNDPRMSDYISNFFIRVVVAENRLRSSSKNLLGQLVPRSSTKFGDCSFSIAGTTEWNSLPDHVKNASSLETFKY